MREIKCRARFRSIRSREECWQHMELNTIPFKTPSGFVQITNWEEYTGLKDKQGKEIFEGDVLKLITTNCDGKESDMIYQIIFKDGMFKAKIIKSTIYKKNVELHAIYNEESVIIGNIYENPELLR